MWEMGKDFAKRLPKRRVNFDSGSALEMYYTFGL